jgi:GT2 family glycosyltransferase
VNAMDRFHIIIVNYKSTDALIRCLQGVAQTIDFPGISCSIYDNSCDDDILRAASRFPQFRIIRNHLNIGFAAAVNRGLRSSRASYIVLLNPDTNLGNGFFDIVFHYMENHRNVGVLGPKVLNEDGSLQESARAFPSVLTGLFGRTSLLSRLFPGNAMTRRNLLGHQADGDKPIEVDWVSGACMVVRRSAAETVGPMDERFFMYWEDADWCRRMREKGWGVRYCPAATLTHSVGKSSRARPIRSCLEFHKSAYRLHAKYARGGKRLFHPIVFGVIAMRFYLQAAGKIVCKLLKPSNIH